MRDIVFCAEGIEHLSALDAEFRFEGVGTIVESCVDDLHKSIRECVLSEGWWMRCTSEFRELVSIPTPPFLSISSVLVPSLTANRLAIASPTAPPPMT